MYRAHPAIQRIQVHFSLVTLVGILLGYISLYLFVGQPTATICAARLWLVAYCFVVLYTPVLLKTTVLKQILQAVSFKRNKHLLIHKDLFMILSGLILLEFVLDIIWMFVSTPGVTVDTTSGFLLPHQMELSCNYGPYSTPFFITSGVLKVFMMLYGCFLAWEMRKVKEKGGSKISTYSEAKEMSFILYNQFVLTGFCIVCVVLLDVNSASPQVVDGIVVLVILLVTSITNVVLFCRRFYFVFTMSPDEYTKNFDDISLGSSTTPNTGSNVEMKQSSM